MKTLLVLRHAKSERESPTGEDFDRPLAKRGRQDGRSVGNEMRKRALDPDAVVASPAKRVLETLAAVAEGYGPLDSEHEPRVYNAKCDALLEVVRDADDNVQRLLLVGHNPGLQQLVLRLTTSDARGLRDSVVEKLPTAAIAEVELPVDEWRNVREGTGRIITLIRPRDLD